MNKGQSKKGRVQGGPEGGKNVAINRKKLAGKGQENDNRTQKDTNQGQREKKKGQDLDIRHREVL